MRKDLGFVLKKCPHLSGEKLPFPQGLAERELLNIFTQGYNDVDFS
jgi:hypothetical protein